MCKGGGQNTVVQQSQPPQAVQQAYSDVMARAKQAANTPLQQYGGPLLAGFNQTQQNAFQQTADAAQAYQPYLGQAQGDIGTALGYMQQGAAPVFGNVMKPTAENIQQFESPYTQSVIDATMKQINQNNAVQQQQLLSQGIMQGNAFGGDRAGIAAAALANQQDLASNQTVAGLYNQNYAQALGEMNQQQNLQLQGMSGDAWRAANAASQAAGIGAQEGQLGALSQNLGLQGASANLQVGGLQQQLQQEQLNIPYEMFQQQQAYPFQTTNFLAQIAEGIGGMTGGTSSTQYPSPSALSQIGGLGMTGLGLYGLGKDLGLFGAAAGAGLDAATLGAGEAVAGGSALASAPGIAAFFGLGAKHGGRIGYDDGGAVENPVPGTPNPMQIAMYRRYLNMPDEDLHRAAVMYPPQSPQGQMVQRALQYHRMFPQSSAPQGQQTQQQGGLNTVNLASPQPTLARGGVAGYQSGGDTLSQIANEDPFMLDEPIHSGGITVSGIGRGGAGYGGGSGGLQPEIDGTVVRGAHRFRLPAAPEISSTVPKPDSGGASGRRGQGPPAAPVASSAGDTTAPSAPTAPTTQVSTAGAAPGSESSPAGGGVGAGGISQLGGLATQAAQTFAPSGAGQSATPEMDRVLNSPWLPLVEAGAATMSGTSPFASVNIGRGLLTGIEGAAQQRQSAVDVAKGRAEAQKAQTEADLEAMMFKLQAGFIGGMLPGGQSGPVSAQTVSAVAAGGGLPGNTILPLTAIAPNYGRDMSMALRYAQLATVFPGAKQMQDFWTHLADGEADKSMADNMTKAGAIFDPEAGGWRIPQDVWNVLQTQKLLGLQTIGKDIYVTTADGQLHQVMYQTTDGKGNVTQVVNPSAISPANAQAGNTTATGTQNVNALAMPWAPDLDKSSGKYASLFQTADKQNNLPKGMTGSVGWVESHLNPNAISPKDAKGVMQFTDAAAKDYHVGNPFDPTQAIAGGGHYLGNMMTKYGDIDTALAAYNWGPGNVDAWLKAGADPSKLPAETRNFIAQVHSAWRMGYGYGGANPNAVPADLQAQNVSTQPAVTTEPLPAATPAAATTTAAPAAAAAPPPPATTAPAPGGQITTTIAQPSGQAGATKAAEDLATTNTARINAAYDASNEAGQLQAQLAIVGNDLDALPETGFLTPGTGADERATIAKGFNTALNILGVKDWQINPDALGKMDELKKEVIRMGYQLTKTLGSREAAQIVMASMNAVPSAANTKLGAKMILASLNQLAQRQLDYYDYLRTTSEAAKQAGTPLDLRFASADFNQTPGHSWQNYAARAMLSQTDYLLPGYGPQANAEAKRQVFQALTAGVKQGGVPSALVREHFDTKFGPLTAETWLQDNGISYQ